MNVVFFTKYTRKGASSRLRTFQYLDYYESQGIHCTVFPFFNDEYLEEVYKYKRHNKWLSFKSFIKRIIQLFGIKKYDKVVIEKELFPYLPAFFERFLYTLNVRYIVDYDDAIFHNYDLHPNPIFRRLLKNKIKKVMRFAGHVVVGNDYLKQKAIEAGANKITIIPTVIDISKYRLRTKRVMKDFTIGWIGSPITAKYLDALVPILKSLAEKYPIRLKLIGANKSLGLVIEELITWREADEADQINTFDVGIMPLEDNIWERGKCGYKLIQYMGCGVPVIGTPIGINAKLIIDGWNGFQATSLKDWETSLEHLIRSDATVLNQLGMHGRQLVEEQYSLQVYGKKYSEILLNS